MANLYRCGSAALVGNATPADVLNGKTFYKDDAGTILTGSMTDRGAVSVTYTPSSSAQTYTIPKGYHDGTGKVTIKATPTETATVRSGITAQTVTPTSGKFLSSVTVSALRKTAAKVSVESGGSVVYTTAYDTGSTGSNYYVAVVCGGTGTVQGSNNNSSWTNLKTVSATGIQDFNMSSDTTAYRYIRLKLQSTTGGYYANGAITIVADHT